MQLVGKVLWWDERDGNGIIKDIAGRKFYFDSSVINATHKNKIKSGLTVRFEVNPEIKDSLCAHKVAVANLREQSRLEREIRDRQQLDLFN